MRHNEYMYEQHKAAGFSPLESHAQIQFAHKPMQQQMQTDNWMSGGQVVREIFNFVSRYDRMPLGYVTKYNFHSIHSFRTTMDIYCLKSRCDVNRRDLAFELSVAPRKDHRSLSDTSFQVVRQMVIHESQPAMTF